MSYHALTSGLGQYASALRDQMAKTRIGIIQTYDPRYHTATVLLQPEKLLTGSLPILSPFVGNGWGLVCAPSAGDQVEVQFQENDLEAGFVVLRFFSDRARPPADTSGNYCPSGDVWLVHQSGSLLKFHGDGSVELTAVGNLNATVGGNLVATVSGTASIFATAINLGRQAGDTLLSLVTSAFVTLYNGHTHPTPSGTSGVPSQQGGAAQETSILKAE